MEPDFSGIQKEVTKTQKTLKSFESNINSIFKGISEGLGINLGKLTKIGLIAAATKKLVDFGKQAIEVASDLTEVQNVVDVTFGAMAADINEFASNATKQFGLSELSAKQFASTMGAMLKSSGITGTAVKDMSIELTKLAADMASFYNLDPEEAFQKIRSGISGETEPLKQLGINMSVANMQAFALSQGINKAWKEMTQAEQTMLRYNYLLSVTSDAQGDFARNAGTWANQIKILKEQWKEFMSLIGKALIEVLLPVVKFLNRALEILIKITKSIGKIYSMITGKNVAVETNLDISDSAEEAADSELDLADGIGEAAKAAKKALAPFDELNILQQNLASGGSGGTSGGLGNLFTPVKSEINTKIDTRQVDDGLEESKRKWEGFFIWLDDWWNRLKQTFSVPIYVPAPIFEPLPIPIYNPDWGLEIPKIPEPVFPPIPSPVYQPIWNLTPPPVPQVVFPAIDYENYNLSLESIKIKTAEAFVWLDEKREEFSNRVTSKLSEAWSIIEGNFNTHKENMGLIAAAVSTVLISNINEALSKLGINTNNTITTTQNNWQTWGKNLGSISGEASKTFTENINEGLRVADSNIVDFGNSTGRNLKKWGEGVLGIAAETARGFVDNLVSGLSAAWQNFKEFMSAIGEKVKGWFSANKKVITTTAIVGGVVLAGAGLALAAPTLIPYAGAALGALKAIPALAKGGITNGPMLAMVGDNPGGREVVSPLDSLMDMIVEAVNTTNTSGGDIHLTIKIGEDTITEKVISNINRQNRIAGKTVIEV